jgi:putative phosphoribosyl transferase
MPCRAELFQDRREAGRVLARAIREASQDSVRDWQDGIVLGLPRGGVPVAYEVARALHLPLDILVVRKLGVAGLEELAMGAVASDGTVVINAPVLAEFNIPLEEIDAAAQREKGEIERRERAYRNGRPPPRIEGRMVVLVDDGLATGASMLAAVRSVRPHAREVVVAVPVAAESTYNELHGEVDEMVCVHIATSFHSVGGFYRNFEQTTEEEVCTLLSQALNGQQQWPADSWMNLPYFPAEVD